MCMGINQPSLKNLMDPTLKMTTKNLFKLI